MTEKLDWIGCAVAVFLVLMYFVFRNHLPVYYRSPADSGIVVDSKSGQPLAGITVKVRWSAMRSTANMHNPETMEINSVTAVTDTNGVFKVGAWGPITVSGGWFYFSTDLEA
jgi:hypothetical protein